MKDKRTADLFSINDARIVRESGGQVCAAWAWRVWLAARYDRRYRPSTVRTYKRAIELATEEWGECVPSRGQVEIWMNGLVAKGMKPQTVNLYRKALAAVTQEAAMATSRHEAHCMADAVAGSRLLRTGSRVPRCPPRGVLAQILNASQSPQEAALARLLSVCGLRIGEARALEWSDVDLVSGRVVVSKSMSQEGVIGERKNRDDHVVVADEKTRKELEKWRRKLNEESLEQNKRGLRGGIENAISEVRVFAYTLHEVRELKKKWRSVTNNGFKTWHDLRHLGASVVAERTGSTAKVQEFLGDKTASAAQLYMPALRSVTQCDAADIAKELE